MSTELTLGFLIFKKLWSI